jgi:hypothetical protein
MAEAMVRRESVAGDTHRWRVDRYEKGAGHVVRRRVSG